MNLPSQSDHTIATCGGLAATWCLDKCESDDRWD